MSDPHTDQQLVDVVLEMADADDELDEETKLLILAALESSDQLRQALATDTTVTAPQLQHVRVAPRESEPDGAFLDSVFRGGFPRDRQEGCAAAASRAGVDGGEWPERLG
ncbi:hypothetical protein [Hoyosella altamirensis]|uniref:hypothetical protein n=1 Tax=Hoyosella altamirensis TaxID=616997 RepID=UPI0018DC6287|nr:hypothetical protein [Hoyosella altamirensis]